jgi:hypothetical protein
MSALKNALHLMQSVFINVRLHMQLMYDHFYIHYAQDLQHRTVTYSKP